MFCSRDKDSLLRDSSCVLAYLLSSSIKVGTCFRYNILAAELMANAKTDKIAAKALFDLVGLENEKYRLGHTKASHSFIWRRKSN